MLAVNPSPTPAAAHSYIKDKKNYALCTHNLVESSLC